MENSKLKIIGFFLVLYLFSCTKVSQKSGSESLPDSDPFLIVLGVAQDAGFPQAACKKDCCKMVWGNPTKRKMVSCLGLVDPEEGKGWIFDATPDFKDQLYLLENYLPQQKIELSGIFLTHAHIGHYTGLMHLGREVIGANNTPVYAMPKMRRFLKRNGPWSQLVSLNNIELKSLKADSTIILNKNLRVTPLQVPHRDEYSETVGFLIAGKSKTALFIPDINKWNLWSRNISALISQVDYAFLDGTFYQNGEIPGRDMSEIPHPFIEESMDLFKSLSEEDRSKIHFIHFNHTNPVLQEGHDAEKKVLENGFHLAKEKNWHIL